MQQASILLIYLLKNFIALKAEIDKLDINTLVNTTGLNDLKTKVDDINLVRLNCSCRFEKFKWCSK